MLDNQRKRGEVLQRILKLKYSIEDLWDLFFFQMHIEAIGEVCSFRGSATVAKTDVGTNELL